MHQLHVNREIIRNACWSLEIRPQLTIVALGALDLLLHLTDRCEVLVDLALVTRAQLAEQRLRATSHQVEHALAILASRRTGPWILCRIQASEQALEQQP